MKFTRTLALAFSAALMTGAADAATFKFTEGHREAIVGSTIVPAGQGTGVNDGNDNPPGFDLGTIGAGDNINVHGRIIEIDDFYQFTITARAKVQWIFEGYETASGFEAQSGYVVQNASSSNDSVLNMFLDTVPSTGAVAAVNNTFVTTIDSTTGDDQVIFRGLKPGTYSLHIDGLANTAGLYDIQISTVPVPAGGLLLMTALGGLGLARRRKKAA